MEALGSFLVAFSVFVLCYFLVVNAAYAVVHLVALRELGAMLEARTFRKPYPEFGSPFMSGVAVVVPASDEAPVIVDSVRSFLDLEYPGCEVIVVNDGSEDVTLERLVEAFGLERIGASAPWELPSAPVCARRSDRRRQGERRQGRRAQRRRVLHGEAAVLCGRCGLGDRTRRAHERRAAVSRGPERTVATGGVVRVANGCSISSGIVDRAGLSHEPLVGVQTVEYL